MLDSRVRSGSGVSLVLERRCSPYSVQNAPEILLDYFILPRWPCVQSMQDLVCLKLSLQTPTLLPHAEFPHLEYAAS